MDASSRTSSASPTTTVLVTGANSGLGFAICCRLIDEFLHIRSQSQSLHLIFSTRDQRKNQETLQRLNAHLASTLQRANVRKSGEDLQAQERIRLEGVLVDLTKLLSVKALAQKLLARDKKIDVVIWNAGISGWSGLNWPKTIWDVFTDLLHNTTYPTFAVPVIGLLADPQLPRNDTRSAKHDDSFGEPILGQVFLANVFGHYMLTHWLAPLFDSESRIIWISSISAVPYTFNIDDIQGLTSETAYEGSKRLTDVLTLTADLPSTRASVRSFLPQAEGERPGMYIAHPGVVSTSFAALHWFIAYFMSAAFVLSRWLGSPWHAVDPYKGAISAVYCALAPYDQLGLSEDKDGKGKWGTAVDVFGNERVARTDVEGWGFGGKPGVTPSGSISGKRGRFHGYKSTTDESRIAFEDLGRRGWREMEGLRVEWESRLQDFDAHDE